MQKNTWIGVSAVLTGLLGGCSSSSAPTVAIGDGGARTDGAVFKSDASMEQHDAAKDASSRADATKHDAMIAGDAGHDALVDAFAHETGTVLDGAGADAGEQDAAMDGVAPATASHLLITFTGDLMSELVALNAETNVVDGRLSFAGFGTTDARNSASLFLLEQNADLVARMNSAKPWVVDSSWNVALTDGTDGGSLYSDPMQVVVEAGAKAYVIRQERNDIAVIDQSLNVEGGAPTSSIDIARFVQSGGDGLVEMTAAAYVSATHRLYVVLANVNQADEATYGAAICSTEVSTVVAIDTATDTIVSLGGTGPGGSIALTYYDPVRLVYDSVGNRLLVASAGCYARPAAGSTTLGAPTLRGVEAVNLATGKSTSLLDLATITFPAGFDDVPSNFVYIDSTHALLQFDGTGEAVYLWNPTSTTLGAVVPNAPDVFAYDGNGHLLGTRVDMSATGVVTTDVVSVTVPAGVSTTLATDVTSLTGSSYVASVDVWPHP